MKFWITIIGLMLNSSTTFCQLKIDEKSKEYFSSSQANIVRFLKDNHFNYALIVYSSSNWISDKDEIQGFIKQKNKWYLAKISKNIYSNHVFSVREHQLNKAEVDSLKRVFDPKEAFKYSQDDFSKLPERCEVKKNTVFFISDAGTFSLLQFSKKKVEHLEFYAPFELFKNCYPYAQEYGILKGFVNTIDQLYIKTKNL